MMNHYPVEGADEKEIHNLAAEERQKLTDLVGKDKAAAYRRTHAQIMALAFLKDNSKA